MPVPSGSSSGTAYATVADMREHLSDSGSNLDAELLERVLIAASGAIDAYCGRRFWQDLEATTRTYRPGSSSVAWVDDISTDDGLIVKTDTSGDSSWATTWDTDDYQLEPLNSDVDGSAYAWWKIAAIDAKTFPTAGRRPTLQVTARFGWSSIPTAVEQACILKAASLYKRKEAPFGIAGFGDMGVVRIGRRDPDVVELLNPLVRVDLGAF